MMQTFLPYPNFAASAGTLDDRRLNKQVVEAYQILTGRLPNRNHLLRKEPDHYAPLFDSIPCDDLPSYPTGYYWPVEPVGKKAKADRAAWLAWAKKERCGGVGNVYKIV